MPRGYFYVIGSDDYPLNYSPRSKFGFNSGVTEPIYNYCINDLELITENVRTLYMQAPLTGAEDTTLGLIIDGTEEFVGEMNIANVDIRNVMRIFEYIYNNQATVRDVATDPAYMNAGDEVLTNDEDMGSVYVQGSASFKANSDYPDRLNSFSLIVRLNGVNRTFDIYFNADEYVSKLADENIKVYQYDDSDDIDTISPDEFDQNIVREIFDILNDNHFNNYLIRSVQAHIDGEIVLEQFYIFHTYSNEELGQAAIDTIITNALKAYLIDKWNGDMEYLKERYPSLFTDDVVKIYPMQTVNTIDGGGPNITVNVTKWEKVFEAMTTLGIEINPGNGAYRAIELFNLGCETDSFPDVPFKAPFVAIEPDALPRTDGKGPITKRFQDFMPIYGSSYPLLGVEWETFHHYLVIINNYFNTPTGTLPASLVNADISAAFVEGGEPASNIGITFTFSGTIWEVYSKQYVEDTLNG